MTTAISNGKKTPRKPAQPAAPPAISQAQLMAALANLLANPPQSAASPASIADLATDTADDTNSPDGAADLASATDSPDWQSVGGLCPAELMGAKVGFATVDYKSLPAHVAPKTREERFKHTLADGSEEVCVRKLPDDVTAWIAANLPPCELVLRNKVTGEEYGIAPVDASRGKQGKGNAMLSGTLDTFVNCSSAKTPGCVRVKAAVYIPAIEFAKGHKTVRKPA